MQLDSINFEFMPIIRKTKSVQILINTIKESSSAISVTDLINRYNEIMNKSTIYRILEKLEHEGIVHSFIGLDGLKWYAKCNNCSSKIHFDTHPHFQCQQCGKLDCLSTNISIPSIPNRKIDFAQVLIVGKCEKCL
ncbi:MAG: transcriptional repressor [Crocinitomicaceae bacterium]|nr:transcriptional repressor [Crocinitomicaceae bacterium]